MTNRPQWCPADVWADAIHRAGGEEFAYPATADAIALAVLAERERCAMVAISGVSRHGVDPWANGYRCASAEISGAIMGGGK